MSDMRELEKRQPPEVKAPQEAAERFIRPRTSIHEYEDKDLKPLLLLKKNNHKPCNSKH